MSLPKPKPWPTELKSYWGVNVPTAVGGTVPQWGTMANSVINAYNSGKAVTYIDATDSQVYYLMTVTATELRFFGRIAPSHPNANTCTQYIVIINRSTGAAARKQLRMSQTGYV